MAVDEKRNRGRPKLRWRDLVKEDMARNQMTTEMAEDRKHWHVMILAGTYSVRMIRVRTGPGKPGKSWNLIIWIPGLESHGILVQVMESHGI